MQEKKKIIINGAGLVGSLLGIYLKKRGHEVAIYERRPDMRLSGMAAGRSINLALSDRGLKALAKVGIADEIKKIAIPMHGRQIHNADGTEVFQPYGEDGQYINSVSRSELNMRLMDLAETNGIKINFNERCSTIDWQKNEVTYIHEDSGKNQTVSADIIFGADGAFSASRLQHQLQSDRFEYLQTYINCGYKELTIPANSENEYAMKVNALHIWPRKEYMLIALPNTDKSFTCTLFFPFEGSHSFDALKTKDDVNTFFNKHFTDAVKLMPTLTDDFFNNPTSSLVTIKCFPWVRDHSFALIGDAAHAMVPFFGQGMNCGFEDCSVLDEIMEKSGDDWDKIFAEYQSVRKPDGDAIADLAVENFIEMRAKTADPKFLMQKKLEAKLHEKFPEKWIPAYSLVTFSPDVRYSVAKKRGMLQENIMQEVMSIPGIEQKWDSLEMEHLIMEKWSLLKASLLNEE
ncbi:MAG: FAD-dependent monooxygenase [Bacteroidetes bacterium]|nr:FAD-dependent monooxygenase [Bacteroidota bacterium]